MNLKAFLSCELKENNRRVSLNLFRMSFVLEDQLNIKKFTI